MTTGNDQIFENLVDNFAKVEQDENKNVDKQESVEVEDKLVEDGGTSEIWYGWYQETIRVNVFEILGALKQHLKQYGAVTMIDSPEVITASDGNNYTVVGFTVKGKIDPFEYHGMDDREWKSVKLNPYVDNPGVARSKEELIKGYSGESITAEGKSPQQGDNEKTQIKKLSEQEGVPLSKIQDELLDLTTMATDSLAHKLDIPYELAELIQKRMEETPEIEIEKAEEAYQERMLEPDKLPQLESKYNEKTQIKKLSEQENEENFPIMFDDLDGRVQDELLKFVGVESPAELNWDTIPVAYVPKPELEESKNPKQGDNEKTQIKKLSEQEEDKREDLIQALSEVVEPIEQAIEQAKNARDLAKEMGGEYKRVVAGQLDAYLIPHLEDWIKDEDQPGSIPSLLDFIESGEAEETLESKKVSKTKEKK